MLRINIITLVGTLIPLVSSVAQYTCQFGPDADGKYVEEVVDSKIALNCDSFCTCVGFKSSICYFGPDDTGNFIKEEGVSSELADSCNRDFCTCDTHEFAEGDSFENQIAKRTDVAVDKTDPTILIEVLKEE